MRNTVISSSAPGIGLATKEKLAAQGDRVIGIDIRDADITADLSTPEGREHATKQALQMSGGQIDAVVLCAGLSGVIAFMLSDAAAYITDMMLWVDRSTDAAVRPDRF